MQLLSRALVGPEYLDQLQRDLQRAAVCRFSIAYFSESGLKSIDQGLLTQVMRDSRSFGVSSMSCSCGYEPLIALQRGIGRADRDVRLKYFMDPIITEGGGPKGVTLLHSKVVYLYLGREQKSVVYLGSHNWTQRALGPGGLRNSEASIRIESDFTEDHLTGNGSSVHSDVNAHLLAAWGLDACLPALPQNERVFQEWYAVGCRNPRSQGLEECSVVLAVCSGPEPDWHQWLALERQAIYMQVLEEAEGDLLFRQPSRVVILVWRSEAALAAAELPTLVKCRISTTFAGRNSRVVGSNTSDSPVAGFRAILWDQVQANKDSGPSVRRPTASTWRGRPVNLYDFTYPSSWTSSAQVAGNDRSKYKFHLEVEQVVPPLTTDLPSRVRYAWTRETFGFAAEKGDAPVERLPGYRVGQEQGYRIRKCFHEVFGVDLSGARVLPQVDGDMNEVRQGKRFSEHDLHETFVGREVRDNAPAFYADVPPGVVAAELTELTQRALPLFSAVLRPLQRVERVFTLKWAELEQHWRRNLEVAREREV